MLCAEQSIQNNIADKGRFSDVTAFIENLFEKKLFRFIFSLVIASIIVFIAHFNCGAFPNDDDYYLSIALSGNYPDGGLSLHVNAFLDKAIIFFNTSFAGLDFFFIFERLTVLFSYAFLIYLLLTYLPHILAFVTSCAIVLMSINGCVFHSCYTFVAALSSVVGLMYAFVFIVKRASAKYLIVGVVLISFGLMWRWSACLLCTPFLFFSLLVTLFFSLRKKDTKNVRCLFTRFAISAIIILLFVGALIVFDQICWTEPSWAYWRDFNEFRTVISDYPLLPYSECAQSLESAGIKEIDYTLSKEWLSIDPQVFTIDNMEIIANSCAAAPSVSVVFSFVQYITESLFQHKVVLIFLVFVPCVFAIIQNPKTLIMFLINYLLAFIICVYFFHLGRLPERVEYPIWVCAILFSSLMSVFLDNKSFTSQNNVRKITVIVSVVFLGLMVAGLAPICTTNILSPIYNQSLQNLKGEYSELYSTISSEENYYLWDPVSANNLSEVYIAGYDVSSSSFLSHNLNLGGWFCSAPFDKAVYKAADMENNLLRLAEKDNAYFITTSPQIASDIHNYIKEHYYPNASVSIVKTISAERNNFLVYKYSTQ